MFKIITCLANEHDLRLVALAACVCVSTAAVTFRVYAIAVSSEPSRKLAWLALTGGCAGSGIWATHFVAMLAYVGSVPIYFEPAATIGSLISAILMATLGFVLSCQRWTHAWIIGGLIVGLAIGVMHYWGMRALVLPGSVIWEIGLATGSWIVGMSAAALAVWSFHRLPAQRASAISAAWLTLAICGLHFTSMAAVTIVPDGSIGIWASAINRPVLAMAVAGVTFIVLLGTLAVIVIQESYAHFEAILREQNSQFEEALHHLPVGLSMFDSAHRLIMCNRAYREVYGLRAEETKRGTPFEDIMSSHAASEALGDGSTEEQRHDWVKQHAAKLSIGKAFTDTQRLNDGRIIRVSVGPVTNGGWVDVQEDITERIGQEAKIEYLALHDVLTGLPNRALLTERLTKALAQSNDGHATTVLYLDLDRFKEANDTFGHRMGDLLLIQVAERLRGCLEHDDFVSRVGGDEFVIVIEHESGRTEVAGLADRIVKVVSAPYTIEHQCITVGTSIGIAQSTGPGIDSQQLIAQADQALYRAKDEGRGTFSFFDESLDLRARFRRELEQNLRVALENGELEVHYQPIVSLENRAVTGFEALLRWRHPKHGLVSPQVFIPIAEETGLIVSIGDWVLRQACEMAATLPSHLRMAVNISPVQFKSPTLLRSILAAVAFSGIKPRQLELEVTETALLVDSVRALAILQNLSDFGVTLALDDFGTGYSSLSYLQKFPFNKIKIDKCFISDLPSSSTCEAIVKAVCDLAHALNLSILGEGVEHEAQADCLKKLGCAEMQGFLFSAALPASDLKDYVYTRWVAA